VDPKLSSYVPPSIGPVIYMLSLSQWTMFDVPTQEAEHIMRFVSDSKGISYYA
jgi:hypothetical protein